MWPSFMQVYLPFYYTVTRCSALGPVKCYLYGSFLNPWGRPTVQILTLQTGESRAIRISISIYLVLSLFMHYASYNCLVYTLQANNWRSLWADFYYIQWFRNNGQSSASFQVRLSTQQTILSNYKVCFFINTLKILNLQVYKNFICTNSIIFMLYNNCAILFVLTLR